MNGTEKMMKDDTQIKKEMMILMFSVWTPGWILGVQSSRPGSNIYSIHISIYIYVCACVALDIYIYIS